MVSESILVSPFQVRIALGTELEALRRDFDPLVFERGRTASAGRASVAAGTEACASCGSRRPEVDLEYAHVIALEEAGFTTLTNIVPLCSRSDKTGCHKLYDDGFASVSEVTSARKMWAAHSTKFDLRPKMLQRMAVHRPTNIGANVPDTVQAFVTKGHYRRALRQIEDLLTKPTDDQERFRLMLKRVEVMRRRSAIGALETAAELYQKLQAEYLVPAVFRSWNLYEGGYIFLLLGEHSRALERFQQSLSIVTREDPFWHGKWAAAASLVVQATVALRGPRAPRSQTFGLMRRALKCAESAAELHGRRWISNCKLHIVTLHTAYGEFEHAQRAMDAAERHWHSMTVLEGWDRGSRATILAIKGCLLARTVRGASDARLALRYLTRSLALMLGARKAHPERARDVLFAISMCLRRIRLTSRANAVEKIAHRTRDGSSWFSPFRSTAS